MTETDRGTLTGYKQDRRKEDNNNKVKKEENTNMV